VADQRDPRDVRIEQLERELEQARREISDLKRVVEELLKRVRKDKRQATPFAKDTGKKNEDKRTPGRSPGHEGAWRERPDHVDEEVEARLDGCPHCGGEVFNVEELLQYVIDLPEVRAHVLRILTERAWCPCCRKQVRSTHPRQVSKAGGAAAVALGPRAMALATELKHQQGVPYRDIASLFGRYFGLKVTHGALVHASMRLADKATPDYLALIEEVQMGRVVHTDDTGWRIAGLCAWLWVFATADVTLYVIDFRRGADVVLDVLGEDFAGTLVSDGLPALNALNEKGFRRGQCNSHIISRCSEMEAVQTRGAVRFPREVKTLLQDALELGRRRHEVPPALYAEAVAEVRTSLAGLVSKDFSHPDNLRLAKHLFRHQDALLRFLDDEAVPPTNNLAEQQLRGAVVTRKIGGCNRTQGHAHAHAILTSLAQTAHRRGETLTPHVIRWMQSATGPPN
jgi:transposase